MFLLFLSILLIKSKSYNQIIAIDFGTTYSRVAKYKNETVDIIADETGSIITPSVVSFDESGFHVGEAAKRQMTVNPTNTIFNIKRLLGLKYSDKELQNEIKNLPYKVVNKDDHPYIQVEFKNETTLFSPEEIASMILSKMKKIAEDHIGCPVKNAVISIPAFYNNAQRKATIEAATFAGINVVRLVTEPTMASLFYRINHTEAKKIITIDFGGGTFDSSVIDVENEVLDVISTNGDTHLGGKDFDDNVIDYLIKQYVKKSGKDPSMNYEAISKLKKEVEKVKCALSSHQEVTIEIENFNDGDDFVEKLTRARFEELNTDIFSKIITILQDVIKESKISKSEIDDIVLTGSSTIIPKVQQIVLKVKRMKMENQFNHISYENIIICIQVRHILNEMHRF